MGCWGLFPSYQHEKCDGWLSHYTTYTDIKAKYNKPQRLITVWLEDFSIKKNRYGFSQQNITQESSWFSRFFDLEITKEFKKSFVFKIFTYNKQVIKSCKTNQTSLASTFFQWINRWIDSIVFIGDSEMRKA